MWGVAAGCSTGYPGAAAAGPWKQTCDDETRRTDVRHVSGTFLRATTGLDTYISKLSQKQTY
eukprot:5107066-Pyramimonas_sp.AAC.1